jgi:hypothetical protein
VRRGPPPGAPSCPLPCLHGRIMPI